MLLNDVFTHGNRIRGMISSARQRDVLLALILVAGAWMTPVCAQHPPAATLEDYRRAALLQNARTLVSRTRLQPNWIAQGDRFWYVDERGHEGDGRAGGKNRTFVLVDPERNLQRPAFDHDRLAAGLSAAAGKAYLGHALPFTWFAYAEGEAGIRVRVDAADWRCDLQGYRCVADATTAGARDGEVLSPDGRWAVSIVGYNLWLRDTSSGRSRALTPDGDALRGYGGAETLGSVTQRLLRTAPAPEVEFSPDSRFLLGYRTDVRRLQELSVIQTVQERAPLTHRYRYPVAGDSGIPQTEIVLFDLQAGTMLRPDVPAFGLAAPYDMTTCWSEDSTRACFSVDERGYKSITLHVVDAITGEVRTPVIERSGTYVNRGSQARIFGDVLLWSSERDGWNHLYRMDARNGDAVRQLTRGDWTVRGIVHVDTAQRQVYFVAGGREHGQDPYARHLYRIGLDGRGLRRLSPEPADHQVAFSPSGRYFVDTYSRLDLPPVSNLRRTDGTLVRELQRADVASLRAIGWQPAQPFTVKAGDGVTDLYGAMFLPSNFDQNKRYPVLDSIYPGPQKIKTPKSFDVNMFEDEMALAELGFVVVTIDGRGTPLRSKAFRDLSYRNMGAAGGLDDHIAGLRQLAERHPFLDLERVGIFGHSGGGYASARAMLKYPAFFKVAVSSAGNHDQRSYWAEWGERFHAWPVDDTGYAEQANAPLAGNLRGKLLLAHGDMDDNVHPANTMQLVDALIAANKDFDLLILPNRDHGFVDAGKGKDALKRVDPYFLRRRWDYFVEHLQGGQPPAGFVLELAR